MKIINEEIIDLLLAVHILQTWNIPEILCVPLCNSSKFGKTLIGILTFC